MLSQVTYSCMLVIAQELALSLVALEHYKDIELRTYLPYN